MHRTAKWLLISFLLAFLFSRTASAGVDLDLWHELALAKEVLLTGHVPWEDHFAYTPKLDIVVHHEWGAGVIALLMTKAFGPGGLLVVKFSLIFGLAGVCWNTSRRRGASALATGLVAGLAIVLGDYSFATVRAQMYSYLLTGFLLWGFDRDRAGDRRLVPAVSAVGQSAWRMFGGSGIARCTLVGAVAASATTSSFTDCGAVADSVGYPQSVGLALSRLLGASDCDATATHC